MTYGTAQWHPYFPKKHLWRCSVYFITYEGAQCTLKSVYYWRHCQRSWCKSHDYIIYPDRNIEGAIGDYVTRYPSLEIWKFYLIFYELVKPLSCLYISRSLFSKVSCGWVRTLKIREDSAGETFAMLLRIIYVKISEQWKDRTVI